MTTEPEPTTPATRDRLIAAATRLIARDGVSATSLADIRAEAGVSVGAVYHHFATKQALADAAWLAALADHQEGFLAVLRAHPTAEEGVRGVVAYDLRWHAEHPGRAQLLRAAGLPSREPETVEARRALNQPFFTELRAWWKHHVATGALSDYSSPIIHALWFGPTQDLCSQWLRGMIRIDLAAAEAPLADAAWAALGA